MAARHAARGSRSPPAKGRARMGPGDSPAEEPAQHTDSVTFCLLQKHWAMVAILILLHIRKGIDVSWLPRV